MPRDRVELTDDPLATRGSSVWRDALANVLHQRSALVGLTIIAALLLIATFVDFLTQFDPNVSMLDLGTSERVARAAPCIHVLGCPATSPEHLLGLDANVRDVFSRVVAATRIDLLIGVATVSLAIAVGCCIGAAAGYFGGWPDTILMRVMDVLLAFPSLLLAIAIVIVLGQGIGQAILAIGIVGIPAYARVIRASVLSVRENDYVTASRALGESGSGILLRRILPNALTPVVVQGTLGIGGAIVDVAALSFLGLGAQPPTAEWGAMIGIERNSVFAAPHLIVFPGAAIILTVLAFNLLGDGLRDALDPRLNR